MSSPESLPPGIIINADDLGIHPSINAGILSAYRRGLLTSCTMLVTTPFFEQTVREFVRPAILPIGIHLSLTLGRATAPSTKIPDLVDEAGNFKLSAARLICSKFASSNGLIAQIQCELRSQLALALDCGLRPTHADSHQHIHMNPAIFAVLEQLLPRHGVDRVRYCREQFPTSVFTLDPLALARRFNLAKWGLLYWRSRQIPQHLPGNDRFFGILYSGAITKKALHMAITRASTNQSTEICIHPGFPASKGQAFYPRASYNSFISSSARQMEHDVLLDAEAFDLLRKRGLVLRAFDGAPKVFS
jgi:predicted glycoside hydrolase/deacetylase ChbG (UPF0249 family)